MQIKKGEIIEGKITGITKYGAFVSVDGEISGMIHISEISSDFVKDINLCLKVDQTVKAAVIGINENGRLALSIKQLRKESVHDESSANPAGKIKTGSDHPEEFVKTDKTAGNPRSFEDMLNKFKRESDDKISALKFLEPKKSGVTRRREKDKKE